MGKKKTKKKNSSQKASLPPALQAHYPSARPSGGPEENPRVGVWCVTMLAGQDITFIVNKLKEAPFDYADLTGPTFS